MATTTNYGWTTPDDTSLVKDGAAAIRTLGSSVDTTTKALNPSTTLGDIEYRSSTANTNTRLGIGSTGQVLTVSGGVPVWATSGATFSGVAVSNSAAISVPNTTFTALTFDTEQLDTDGYHSTVTNTSRITIPAGKTGKFSINGAVTWNANATGDRYLTLRLNGNAIGSQLHMGTAAGKNFGIFETIYSLDAGDYIELFAYQASGGSLDVRCDDLATLTTRFQATYLGA
jgi:hypothetical protein